MDTYVVYCTSALNRHLLFESVIREIRRLRPPKLAYRIYTDLRRTNIIIHNTRILFVSDPIRLKGLLCYEKLEENQVMNKVNELMMKELEVILNGRNQELSDV